MGYLRLKQEWRWGCLETEAQIPPPTPGTSASQICSQALEISSNITPGPRPTEGSYRSSCAALPLQSWKAQGPESGLLALRSSLPWVLIGVGQGNISAGSPAATPPSWSPAGSEVDL